MCPCPRCLVSKSKLDKLGLKRDMATRIYKFRHYMAEKVQGARNAIYSLAKPINGAAVEAILKEFSGVPTVVRSILICSGQFLNKSFLECLCGASRL